MSRNISAKEKVEVPILDLCSNAMYDRRDF